MEILIFRKYILNCSIFQRSLIVCWSVLVEIKCKLHSQGFFNDSKGNKNQQTLHVTSSSRQTPQVPETGKKLTRFRGFHT